MVERSADKVREGVDALYRSESRRILATLIRLLGDFDLAEDALHDAFRAASEQWPKEGVPANPRAWLVSAGRFKAIDSMRRSARFDASQAALAEQLRTGAREAPDSNDEAIEDDRLRLIFTCCHPAQALEWTRRFPNPAGEGANGEIQLRQLFELDDFEPSEAVERFRDVGVGSE